ncbi:MAG: hypothetical protein JXR37_12975 [Kiritimatiellae bacterium]|nr:hypothetical protein [Kiritimatiellia bacterium]
MYLRDEYSLETLTPESRVEELGLRFYSPNLGRWVSRDPIEESGGVNLYGFVACDRISRCDLLGGQTMIPSVFPPAARVIQPLPTVRGST